MCPLTLYCDNYFSTVRYLRNGMENYNPSYLNFNISNVPDRVDVTRHRSG